MCTKDGSATNVVIDAALVRRLVADRFPRWADLPIEPVEHDGWDNRTFRLGAEMAVRLPGAERYAAQVGKEHAWLPRLAPRLPLPIPTPLAIGFPAAGYPWRWSVYRWLDGTCAARAPIDDRPLFATTLGRFLAALQRVDPAGGPPPGRHNFFRGGALATYDRETRAAIASLRGTLAADAATATWDAALEATWRGPPVWLHGDVAPTNLLVRAGRLVAVIDFGCSAVGDPARDLTIAWTFLAGASREAFRAELAADEATWTRARGWALWKALITLDEHLDVDASRAAGARRTIDQVLAEPR